MITGAAAACLVAGGWYTESFASTSTPTSLGQTSVTTVKHHGHPEWTRMVMGKSMSQLAGYFNMTPQQLRTELESGKSLDQVAQEHNISQAALQTKVESLVHTILETRVSAGHLTQSRETKLEQAVDAKLPTILASTHLVAKPMEFKAQMYFMDKVAQDLHMTRSQLVTDLKGGQSIAQVAQAHGVSASQLTADLQQAIDQQVNKRVSTLVNKNNWFHKASSAHPGTSASGTGTGASATAPITGGSGS